MLLHGLSQIAVRRRNQTKVHLQRLRSTQPFELVIPQNPQQFRLQRQRNLPDLVQKQRALVGQFGASNSLAHRSGERAFLTTE